MEQLTPDIITYLGSNFLSVSDLVHLASTCKRLHRAVNGNSSLWCSLSVKLLGKNAKDTKEQLNTNIGLAEHVMTWREFFTLTYGSEVLTWGSGGGRTGHGGESWVGEPTVLQTLSKKAVDFVGKTAEVGSIVIGGGGSQIWVWGSYAGSTTPVCIEAKDLCNNSNDKVIEASCGHDTGFVLVFRSGRVMIGEHRYYYDEQRVSAKAFHDITKSLLEPLLLDGEKCIKSLGSQASRGGVFTNKGRVLAWSTYTMSDYLSTLGKENVKKDDSFDDDHNAFPILVRQDEDGIEIGMVERNETPSIGSSSHEEQEDDAAVGEIAWNLGELAIEQKKQEPPEEQQQQQQPEEHLEPIVVHVDAYNDDVSIEDDGPLSEHEEEEDVPMNYGFWAPRYDSGKLTVSVIDPVDASGQPIRIARVAFGHKTWFAITEEGHLYETAAGSSPPWRRVKGTEHITDPIVMVDSGSEHHAFCTLGGDAYTWGCTNFGMLGHGHMAEYTWALPKKVDFFSKLGKRVVAIGAGGYISWSGAFTLFLLEDNTLWKAGRLGDPNIHDQLPVQIMTDSLRGRHILSISCGEDWAAVVTSARSQKQKE